MRFSEREEARASRARYDLRHTVQEEYGTPIGCDAIEGPIPCGAGPVRRSEASLRATRELRDAGAVGVAVVAAILGADAWR